MLFRSKRSEHLQKALDIIAENRNDKTPVGIVGRAYREGQDVRVVTLGSVDPESVDMQTVLIIGNSATRVAGGRMLTPRGYHRKYDIKNSS